MRGDRGQSFVEYAVVLMAFVSVACSLSLVWHAVHNGSLLDRAIAASSHQWGGGAINALRDLLPF
jgi:hypothetical protein